jgi:hypothetical protein
MNSFLTLVCTIKKELDATAARATTNTARNISHTPPGTSIPASARKSLKDFTTEGAESTEKKEKREGKETTLRVGA